MSKIVQAINKMIENKNKIEPIIKGLNENEIFFLYDKKYRWSIVKNDSGAYYLFFYNLLDYTIERLAAIPSNDFSSIPFVSYSTEEINTREANQSFGELFNFLFNKLFGAEDILDEIINS